MTEQDLATSFKKYAEKLKRHRAELVSLVPEVADQCAALDELAEYLENWPDDQNPDDSQSDPATTSPALSY